MSRPVSGLSGCIESTRGTEPDQHPRKTSGSGISRVLPCGAGNCEGVPGISPGCRIIGGGVVGALGICCDGSVSICTARADPASEVSSTSNAAGGTCRCLSTPLFRCPDGDSSNPPLGLLVFVAEMGAHDTCFQVLKRAKVLDDVAASVIKEQFAIFGAPDSNNPFKIVSVFQQVIDSLGNATARDDRDFLAR